MGLLTSVLVLLPCSTGGTEAPQRPNIIIILADDLGWSDLGCYGGEMPTPHLDALAAQGLRFKRFYNNAVCGPSRASLLTGLYCQQIGHRGDHWNQPTDFRKCATIAELLKRAGYRTLMIGKWQERQSPLQHGFDRFFGPMCQAKISYFHEVKLNPFYLNERRWQFPKEGKYITEAFTENAIRFIEEAAAPAQGKQAAPFFLYLAHLAPHWPLHAPEADIAPHRQRYREHGWDHWRSERFQRQRTMGLIPKDWSVSAWPKEVHPWKADKHHDWQAERMAVYASQVAALDRSVGQVMETVRKAGAADNTLVLFLSDNGGAADGVMTPSDRGYGFGPKEKKDDWRLDGVPIRPGSGPKTMPGPADTFSSYGPAWATVSNTPFRNAKTTAYEGGIRTPLIASWPAVMRKGGQVTSQVGHVIDLMPTCLEIAGASYPKEIQDRRPLPLEGKSLAPIFRGAARPDHEVLCWNAPRNQAIRMGRWMLVNAAPGQPWELYDLDADGTQTRNLAAQHPERVQEMAERWQSWVRRCAGKK